MKRLRLLAPLLAAGCASAPAAPRLELSPRVDTRADRFEVPFDGRAAVFTKKPDTFYEIAVPAGSTETCRPHGGDWDYLLPFISTVGVASIGERRELFIAGGAGGTGQTDVALVLVDPGTCAVTGLTFVIDHQDTRPVTPQSGLGGYSEDRRWREALFLDRIKTNYGYVGQDDVDRDKRNPRFAYYFWAKDNGAVQDGRLKVRRYPGKPPQSSSAEAALTINSITYTAQFKSGVIAYDPASDEHYVLFHPDDMYHWPSLLAGKGDVLLIGTRGEGAVAVHLKSLRLKRFPLAGQDADVHSIEVYASSVTVNGKVPLDLKGF